MGLKICNYQLTGRRSLVEIPVGSMVLGCKNSYRDWETGWRFPYICCLVDKNEKQMETREFSLRYVGWTISDIAQFVGMADYLVGRVFIFEERHG